MKRVASCFALSVAASLLPLCANAQSFRAYVASYGNDSNPGCSVTAPCRLLPAALNAIGSGGEVWMLDSANFNTGTVNVNKNANILAVPGQVGSIVAVASSPAISLGAALSLSLRNVAIVNNATNPGTDGVVMSTGTLSVDDSLIAVNGSGILDDGAGIVSVHNATFRGGTTGIWARGGASVAVSRSKFFNTSYAVYVEGSTPGVITVASVHDSAFSKYYIGAGAVATVSSATAKITVLGSTFSEGTYGVVSQSNTSGAIAVASVGSSQAFANATAGFFQFAGGATFESLGNNLVRGNANNAVGVITPVSGL